VVECLPRNVGNLRLHGEMRIVDYPKTFVEGKIVDSPTINGIETGSIFVVLSFLIILADVTIVSVLSSLN
jgi:hypothetical protein